MNDSAQARRRVRRSTRRLGCHLVAIVLVLGIEARGGFADRRLFDYVVTQDGAWTVVTYIDQRVGQNDMKWTATPGIACSHYSFALRKLTNTGGDTRLLGRFNAQNERFEFRLEADQCVDLGALLQPPRSLGPPLPDKNEELAMEVGHYYHAVFGKTHALLQILSFNPEAESGGSLGNLSVSFRYLVSQSGINEINTQLSQVKAIRGETSGLKSPIGQAHDGGRGGYPFKALVYTFLLGVLSTFFLLLFLLVRSAKRAGKGIFDFLASGWLGSRGIDALQKRGKRE